MGIWSARTFYVFRTIIWANFNILIIIFSILQYCNHMFNLYFNWSCSNKFTVSSKLFENLLYKKFIYHCFFRTMTVSLLMMCGRFGALFGNLLFPIFMEIDCVLPFLLVGGTTFGKNLFFFLKCLKTKALFSRCDIDVPLIIIRKNWCFIVHVFAFHPIFFAWVFTN